MKVTFKNKFQKWGYYFAIVIRDMTVVIMLFSLLVMCNDNEEIDWKSMTFFLVLFASHIYGCWRTGYDVRDKYDE